MARRGRPKPLDIVSRNLVDRLWDEKDPVCDRKALMIVRSVLGQVAAEAAREATRKASRLATAERAVIEAAVSYAAWCKANGPVTPEPEEQAVCAAVDALIAAREGR